MLLSTSIAVYIALARLEKTAQPVSAFMELARMASDLSDLPQVSVEPLKLQVASQPQQARSRLTYERMLQSAEALMIERGSDNFSLNEVCEFSKVSIGALYNRFAGKEVLIHTVCERALTRIETEQHERIVVPIDVNSMAADKMIYRVIPELGQCLADNANLLRPIMRRAAADRAVRERGAATYGVLMQELHEIFSHYQASFRHRDFVQKVDVILNVTYSTYARALGLGMVEEHLDRGNYTELQQDLSEMAVRFLLP